MSEQEKKREEVVFVCKIIYVRRFAGWGMKVVCWVITTKSRSIHFLEIDCPASMLLGSLLQRHRPLRRLSTHCTPNDFVLQSLLPHAQPRVNISNIS